VWQSVWSRSIGTSLPLCRELLLDSFLWLIHKTSTFNISLQQEDDKRNDCDVTMQEVCLAVNEEFGASLLPDNMISAVLLLSLSHGLLVDTSLCSELQRVSRKCDSAATRVLLEKLTSNQSNGNSGHGSMNNTKVVCEENTLPQLLIFRDRGYLCATKTLAGRVLCSRDVDTGITADFSSCIHCPIGVEKCQEVSNCVQLNRGFSRCFRGLIETFALPELAMWLSQVLLCAPFTYHRRSGSGGGSRDGSLKSPAGESSLSPTLLVNDGRSCDPVITKKIHRNSNEDCMISEEPTSHSLAILGAFVSAGNARRCLCFHTSTLVLSSCFMTFFVI
jgi:hypothetical protein